MRAVSVSDMDSSNTEKTSEMPFIFSETARPQHTLKILYAP